MTSLSPDSKSVIGPLRLGREHRAEAASRLAGMPPRERPQGRRSLEAFAELGIPLDHAWGTMEAVGVGRYRIRHVCLVVPGSGRTGMLFLSPLDGCEGLGSWESQAAEIGSLIETATRWVRENMSREMHLLQALPSPQDVWVLDACSRAGYVRIGDLLYLRADVEAASEIAGRGTSSESPPDAIRIRAVRPGRAGWEADCPLLLEALERSYIDTLDCPELCGLRETPDVLESHLKSGRFDPETWYLVLEDERAAGCALFSECIGKSAMELVYLGLAPQVRGKGLGRHLLWRGIEAARQRGLEELTCAVDARNVPARTLYGRLGMSEVSRRVAFVASTRA